MLRISAEHEKGNQDRLLPMTPDFAELLQSVPVDQQTGRVFKLELTRKCGDRLHLDTVSRAITRIGKAANVKVHTDPKTGKVKYASAHDLRRSFGERWAMKLMPPALQQLMRHEAIETTMQFYVGRNALTAADAIWDAFTGSARENEKPAESVTNDY